MIYDIFLNLVILLIFIKIVLDMTGDYYRFYSLYKKNELKKMDWFWFTATTALFLVVITVLSLWLVP